MIILCKAPRYHETYFEENSESLALASLSAYLRASHFDATVFDASLEGLSLEEAKERLLGLSRRMDPLIIGFTIADMTYIESTVEVAEFLKRNGVSSHMTIGGHAPTFNYRDILEICPALDSVVCNEGEYALHQLASALREQGDWRGIPNIAYRNAGGEIVANPPSPLVRDLDSLPFPARDYLPFVREHMPDRGIVPMASSRGCYKSCGFCSVRGFYGAPEGPLWRSRSVANIVEEIKGLKERFTDIKEIVFVDDLFLGHPRERMERLVSFRDSLNKNNLKLVFSISDRVDNINDAVAELWHQIGVRQILIGLESGTQDILDRFNKGITLEDQKRALRILERHNIDPTVSFINFTPWSTIEQIEESLLHFSGLRINLLQGLLNRFQLYDGTPLTEQLKTQGRVCGTFPNQYCLAEDHRVENLYKIVERCFSPYLDIAYKLKMVERSLRFALFNMENFGNVEEFEEVKRIRDIYLEMMNAIMKEAIELFFAALLICKAETNIDVKLYDKISNKVLQKANSWLKMVEMYRLFFIDVMQGGDRCAKSCKKAGAT